MKCLAARKLYMIANNIQNERTHDLETELETMSEMLLQLSQLTDVNLALDLLEYALQLLQDQASEKGNKTGICHKFCEPISVAGQAWLSTSVGYGTDCIENCNVIFGRCW